MRNCPAATSTNATTARKVFNGLPQAELDIPCWINDYNHHMNSVDLANQFREAYDTQQIALRTWIPLLHWVLDQAAINAYKIGCIGKTWMGSHLDFRRELYQKLLAFSNPPLWKDPGPHNWKALDKRKTCAWCLKAHKLKKKILAMQEEAGIEVVKEISTVARTNDVETIRNWVNRQVAGSQDEWLDQLI